MADPGGRFDDPLEGDGLRAAHGAVHGRDKRIHCIDIGSAADLGDHDLVKPVARLFQQVHDIAVPPGRVQPVDPHRRHLVGPVRVADRLEHCGAGSGLVCRGDGLLKVRVDHIRRTCRHLRKQRGARSEAKQLAAVRTGRGGAGGCWRKLFGTSSQYCFNGYLQSARLFQKPHQGEFVRTEHSYAAMQHIPVRRRLPARQTCRVLPPTAADSRKTFAVG